MDSDQIAYVAIALMCVVILACLAVLWRLNRVADRIEREHQSNRELVAEMRRQATAVQPARER